ncbi:MAG: sensor histidine kinase [Alphaproteobacteria bacterium]
MTQSQTPQPPTRERPKERPLTGLSARALVLTVMFVLLAETVLFMPSLGRWLEQELNDRLSDGHLAIRTLEVVPDAMPTGALTDELLAHVDADLVAFRAPGQPKLALFRDPSLRADSSIDLRRTNIFQLSAFAWKLMLDHRADAIVRVVGTSPVDPMAEIELLLGQQRICANLRSYALRIALLSMFIGLVTGFLLYLTLRWLIVRPVVRLTQAVQDFAEHPEVAHVPQAGTKRRDEIGTAFRQLDAMQTTVRAALAQNRRLASLGTGVAKISHDLRNLLTTSLLITERMQASQDERIAKAAPRLSESIERAATLTHTIVQHAREGLPPLSVEPVVLKPFFGGVIDRVRQRWGPEGKVVSLIEDYQTKTASLDPLQIERVLNNLLDNAFEAGAGKVDLQAIATAQSLTIIVSDDGAGIPDAAVAHLFDAFKGSTKRGGTGLGLHNSAEIIFAHRGSIELTATGQDAEGPTTFRIELPQPEKTE